MWYHPKGISNIIGLSNIADNYNYWVQYDSQYNKDFVVTRIKDGKETRFSRAPRGLHWVETKATTTGVYVELLINIVEDKKCSYTRYSYLRSKSASKLQRIIG